MEIDGGAAMLGKIFLCNDSRMHDSNVYFANPILVQIIPTIPFETSFKLLGCVAIEDVNKTEYNIGVVLKDEINEVVTIFEGQISNSDSSEEVVAWRTNLAFSLTLDEVKIKNEGLFAFELYVDDELVDSTSFRIMKATDILPNGEVN